MNASPKAIVIGASAGALDALSVILPALPASFKLPLMVVVHIPPDKHSILAELFQAKCRITAVEAEDKEPIMGGTAYFAPPDYHLLVETNGTLSLSSEEPVLFSRPSIDVLFESAADAYGPDLTAIVLTGANEDGAKGLACVVEAGGTAIVQNPQDAFASAMPESAIAICPDAQVMSLAAIAAYLQKV
ncbi:two-component system chemotaxis response regulator CheB [Pararhizobium capsulatum DSM 1112]|uniref:protein-glutamate methylesterase n=1 Tax=Pararhizobium capsulatum DSM 1112 TaxID=1121113 RepID=A0ABU0BVF4_9HYPH|nr:chemotaxis protein CheB [Pararhizobium capsulatum]MDQ0321962.1 two-component system chemotaxis response regulator CheB [Pararhizobium capsulatum DSM 1112]